MLQGTAETPQALTFEQRVEVQEAIDRVYFTHRIGTTRTFEEALPREVLENKVRNYLAQSAALEQLWGHPVTGEMLRSEMGRMAWSTSFPERLRELHTALGNDAFLVQECLARQILVNRLARQHFAYDEEIHWKQRREAELLREQLLNGAIDRHAEIPSRIVLELLDEGRGARFGGPLFQEVGPDGIECPERGCDGLSEPRAGLTEPGAIGPVEETRDGFVFQVVLDQEPTRVRVATYSVRKRSREDWWSGVSMTLDGQAVQTAALEATALPLPASALSSCPEWMPTAVGADAPTPRFRQAGI